MNKEEQKTAKTATRAAGMGCLPFVISCLLLSSMGFCGTCAKQHVVGGVHDIAQAVNGEPAAK